MTHIDDAVRSALSAEDAKLYDALGRSRNPVQAALATLSGEQRIFAIGGWMLGFALFAVAIYAGFRFAEADTTREMTGWAAVAVVAFLALGFLKLWFFMEVQKDAVLRELKRVELELAALMVRRA